MPAVLPEGSVVASADSGQIETDNTKPAPRLKHEPGEPPYRVVGTVAGVTPVAILEDDGGKQYFLKIGGSAGDARLISVSQRHVVIEYGGQNHTLSMGNY
ncbi:MAG: hypothetical protein K8R88_13425 [Armatimonadetes bacterium]|nr:hypothetical protein [Armatimonadota bacterium]